MASLSIPKLGSQLNKDQIKFLETFSKSCRKSIIEMLINSESGHPGGSLSSIDYLSVLYTFILSQTGEKITISNGHISPAIYSILGELGYVDKEDAIQNFRKTGSIFEGHVARHVPGIFYGTGPLGIGASVGSAFALAEKLKKSDKKVFAEVGDGECQEGEIHEMIHFSRKYKLNNFILFVDYNKVQLSGSLDEIEDIDIEKVFAAGHFEIINCNAHNFEDIWKALSAAHEVKDKPVVILGHSIMGKGIGIMEKDGLNKKSTWHGKAPKKEEVLEDLNNIVINEEEKSLLKEFKKLIKWHPGKPSFTPSLEKVKINLGTPKVYEKEESTDCRTAYGKALQELAELNSNILALTADLRASVMTKFVAETKPEQHIECGIAEQHMVATSGGLSLYGFIPFCSTFGAFMSSRAKDQARVNDINRTNVKMVATHCGLSVGEDGPTHQAIDDAGSFLGMFNTMTIEPADPNHTDRIIRYIASHYGNFYVRMGRHKIPTICKENGEIFYDKNYKYEYGKCDILRTGNDLTIAVMGSLVTEALKAYELLKKSNPNLSIEIIAVSSIKQFDKNLTDSIKKTKKVLTIEDHNTLSGLGGQLSRHILKEKICPDYFEMLGVESYQLSGKPEELYALNNLSGEKIAEKIAKICQK